MNAASSRMSAHFFRAGVNWFDDAVQEPFLLEMEYSEVNTNMKMGTTQMVEVKTDSLRFW